MRESEIEEKTLVIGAGASVDFSHNNGVDLKEHFAFPSGEELLERLKNPVIGGFTFNKTFYYDSSDRYPSSRYFYSDSILSGYFDDFKLHSDEWYYIFCSYAGFNAKYEGEILDIYKSKIIGKNGKRTIEEKYQDTMNSFSEMQKQQIINFDTKIDFTKSDWLFEKNGLLLNINTFCLDQLLIHLLNLHKPLSIDYYISNNLKSHITEEHLNNAKRLKLTFNNKLIETKEDLEKAVEKHAINKITHILSNCKVENLQNGYFANILCNYITLDKIQNLEIITFNYDLILEQTIDYLIGKNTDDKRKKKLEKLKKRIKHVYGDIEKDITFIRDDKKETYKNLLNTAKSIYFLGFGFDETNLKNLGIDKGFKDQKERLVFITNFSKLSKLEYAVERAFKCKFEFVREGSRKCYKGKEYFIIAEKSITQSLEGDLFFL